MMDPSDDKAYTIRAQDILTESPVSQAQLSVDLNRFLILDAFSL